MMARPDKSRVGTDAAMRARDVSRPRDIEAASGDEPELPQGDEGREDCRRERDGRDQTAGSSPDSS